MVIGAPTWWLSTDVPIREFLESDTAAKVLKGKPFTGVVCCRRYWKHNLKSVRRIGTKRGGDYVDGIGFRYQGGQIRSLFSLLSYLGYRRVQGALPRGQDPPDEPSGLPPRSGPKVRR